MPPDKDAVLMAMRSDLGMGRVDDLELENGHRGQTIRPGQSSQALPGRPLPAPRNPLPLATRWQAAIKKGEFDDDDAEAVKGLDRIGGGRLHALKSTPATSSQNFYPRPQPSFGLRLDRRPISSRPSLDGLETARGSSLVNNGSPNRPGRGSLYQSENRAPTMARLTQPKQNAPLLNLVPPNLNGAGARPVSGKSHPLPPTPPHDTQVVDKNDNMVSISEQSRTSTKSATQPSEYFYKEDIHVADRQAKGRGVVYLLATSASDPGIISVYLEGLKYLEYPVVSMFNYIANTTQLCPQFKEADGVSITTTALVFGSQNKIADFMQAIKTLKGRQPAGSLTNSPANTPMKIADGSSFRKPSPASSQNEPIPPVIHGDGDGGGVKSTTLESKTDNALSSSKDTDHAARATPLASRQINKAPNQHGTEMAYDLVDLSQTSETTTPKPFARSNRQSAYVMDLESLCSSPALTANGSSDSNSNCSTVAQSIAPRELPSVSGPGDQDSTRHSSDLPRKGDVDSPESLKILKDLLQSCIITMLPTFEAISEVLSSVSERDRENTAMIVFSGIPPSDGEGYKLSAKLLLKALLARSAMNRSTILASPQTPSRGPRYSRNDILSLRGQGIPTPESLLKLAFLPRPVKNKFSNKDAARGSFQIDALLPEDKQRSSILRPSANPFQPSPTNGEPLDTSPAKGDIGDLTNTNLGTPSSPSPMALSNLSNSSNDTSHAVSVVAQRLSAEVTPTSLKKKGLQGSRWAATNANHAHEFTGSEIPRQFS